MAKRKQRSAKGRKSRTATGRYEVALSARGLPRVLLITALALLACHAGVMIYHYRVEELPWLVRQLFDVDKENNLPTWFSEFLLLCTCIVLWVCAQQKKADGDEWRRYWLVLAVGFLLMSVDEVAGVHESINSAIVMTWAIPAGIGALVIGVAMVPFLVHLPRRTGVLFALSGAIYVTGATGIEIIGNSMSLRSLKDTLGYKMMTMLEESLEMFGVILFLFALLDYMRGRSERVDASLEVD